MDFEQLFNDSLPTDKAFKISPLNFSPGMPTSYFLEYIFEDSKRIAGTQLILTAENNSVSIDGEIGKQFDGTWRKVRADPGRVRGLTVTPQKFKFLKGSKGCRDKPHNEILLQKIAQDMDDICEQPCRPSLNYGKRLNRIIEHLPFCKTQEEESCFWEFTKKKPPSGEVLLHCFKLAMFLEY